MKVRATIAGLAFVLILWASTRDLSAQEVPAIIPLQATCDDVKRILKVENCSYPQSVFLLPEFWIVVNFVPEKPSGTDKRCYKVPAGRVSSFSVSYNKPFPIQDFPLELKYVEGPFGDIGTVAYANKINGITAFTNSGKIRTVVVEPNADQRKELVYECRRRKSN